MGNRPVRIESAYGRKYIGSYENKIEGVTKVE